MLSEKQILEIIDYLKLNEKETIEFKKKIDQWSRKGDRWIWVRGLHNPYGLERGFTTGTWISNQNVQDYGFMYPKEIVLSSVTIWMGHYEYDSTD